MNHKTMQMITYCGILTAMSAILTRFISIRLSIGGVENIRLGLGPFPILLAGVLFGPLIGAIVGILADLIGFTLSNMGGYMPHFTIVSAMYGFIPGLFMQLPFSKAWTPMASFRIKLILGVIVSQILTQWLLLPWFLLLTFKMDWRLTLIPRFFTAPIQMLAYILLGYILFAHPLFAQYVKKIKASK